MIRINNPACQDAIKFNNVTKYYPNGYLAIKNNTFGVEHGKIFGLLGPNGAGKSTTFNILTAMIPKSQGSVQVENQEIENCIMELF